jgi:diaminopimelate epimerase
MNINFSKMVGSGNDFIMIDNRNNIFDPTNKTLVKKLCNRTQGIGADGIILIEESKETDFIMRIINADGSEAEMCGNGARCAAYFAYIKQIANKNMRFETLAGIINADIDCDEPENRVKNIKVRMPKPHSLKQDIVLNLSNLGETKIYSINTGVPHAVIFVEDIENIDINKIGSFIRYNEIFAPNGTNVNFASIKNDNEILVRTYERGVEGETLSCGSGSTAAAIITALRNNLKSPLLVNTRSGEILKIYFELQNNDEINNVYLEGLVELVFEGKI